MRLRLAGLDYAEIAHRLGYADKSGAYRAATRALEAAKRETAHELLGWELGRLDVLLASLWPAATTGDLPAVDRVLKVMDRRAKYLGLDSTPLTEELIAELRQYRLEEAAYRLTPEERDARRTAIYVEMQRRAIEQAADFGDGGDQ